MLGAKLFSFTSAEYLSEGLVEVDSDNNVHVIMGRLTYFALVKLTNDLTLTKIMSKTRPVGTPYGTGNLIYYFGTELYILGRVSDSSNVLIELVMKSDINHQLINSCY